MSPDLDALSKRIADELMRKYESDILRALTPLTAQVTTYSDFKFVKPDFKFEPIYDPERDGSFSRRFDPWNQVIVHQPSALLMVTTCESDAIFFTERESRAMNNWKRAKARKDRRRMSYWKNVFHKLERSRHR